MDHSSHIDQAAEAAASGSFSENFVEHFSQYGFMPHGHCYLWKPGLVGIHVVSDLLIGLAYVSISLSLYALVKKIRLPFSTMVVSFGVFIGACGLTHFMEIWNLWNADYWVGGFIKVITAIASVATGVWLFRLKPAIIEFAEAAKLSEQRRMMLETVNEELEMKTLALLESNRQLEEQQKVLAHSAKMSALGEMAGGIAHEINSPLGIITLHANQMERLLKRGQLSDELIAKETQLIAATAKRIGDIIKGLRTFAREGSEDPFEIVPVRSIVEDAFMLCQSRFESHQIKIEYRTSNPELDIECRPVQITQVLLNLLSNAFDAVEVLTEKWVHIEVKESDHSVELAVVDSGHGVAPELLPKIMQPFFTSKEVGRGTGLGLSISEGLVESHGGTLKVDTSSPHTRFVVHLPRRQAKGSTK